MNLAVESTVLGIPCCLLEVRDYIEKLYFEGESMPANSCCLLPDYSLRGDDPLHTQVPHKANMLTLLVLLCGGVPGGAYYPTLLVLMYGGVPGGAWDLTLLHVNDIHVRMEETNKYSAACRCLGSHCPMSMWPQSSLCPRSGNFLLYLKLDYWCFSYIIARVKQLTPYDHTYIWPAQLWSMARLKISNY